MKTITLSRGKFAIVDDEDFDRVSKYKWYCSYYGYAVRTVRQKNGKRGMIWLHKFVLKTKSIVDHINGDPLDNRKSNLRKCSNRENTRNTKVRKNSQTGFKGVSWHKQIKKYRAFIKVNYKQIHLGTFNCKIEAAKAYNKAAIKYHGDFAKLNEGI